jgi:hypothetical protein
MLFWFYQTKLNQPRKSHVQRSISQCSSPSTSREFQKGRAHNLMKKQRCWTQWKTSHTERDSEGGLKIFRSHHYLRKWKIKRRRACWRKGQHRAAEEKRRPSAHPIYSLSFVCPEVRKHTVVLNYQAQSAAGIFAGRFQQRKPPPPPAPRGGYQQIAATKMFSPAFRLPLNAAHIYLPPLAMYLLLLMQYENDFPLK